jgi:hypothetical protein
MALGQLITPISKFGESSNVIIQMFSDKKSTYGNDGSKVD